VAIAHVKLTGELGICLSTRLVRGQRRGNPIYGSRPELARHRWNARIGAAWESTRRETGTRNAYGRARRALCGIGQLIALPTTSVAEKLIVEGRVSKDGDLYELMPKGENILADRGARLNVARAVKARLTNNELDLR
jgi:hypothetical protein